MAWGWPWCDVRVTHLPTGLVARANEMRSQWKCREACFRMLRGMLWRKEIGPRPLVRTYEIPDGAFTTVDLETGACIDRSKRRLIKSPSI